MSKNLIFLILSLLPGALRATEGTVFYHKDWMLACDNTGTCRAAGYQTDGNFDELISVLFTREAGENTPVSGQIQISTDGNENPPAKNEQGDLLINNQLISSFNVEQIAELNNEQVRKLLTALKGSLRIEVKYNGKNYRLSAEGFNAVWLKMNEFQGRLKGQTLLPPTDKPRLIKAQILNSKNEVIKTDDPRFKPIISILSKEISEYTTDSGRFDIGVYPLDQQRTLVQTIGYLAAYNSVGLTAIMNSELTQIVQPIGDGLDTADFNDYENGVLSDIKKERGVGDCWGTKQAVWTGNKFELSREYNTGLCRGFAGGAWEMPTFVSEIKELQ